MASTTTTTINPYVVSPQFEEFLRDRARSLGKAQHHVFTLLCLIKYHAPHLLDENTSRGQALAADLKAADDYYKAEYGRSVLEFGE